MADEIKDVGTEKEAPSVKAVNPGGTAYTNINMEINYLIQAAAGVAPASASWNIPKNFVSVAQSALSTYGKDAVYGALTNVIGQTIFSTRPYSAKFPKLEKSLSRWGMAIRKLSIVHDVFDEDNAYAYPVLYNSSGNPPTGDGKTVDQWTIKKSKILETVFVGQSVYGDHITLMEDQLETAFQGPEQLNNLISLIMGELSNKLEMSREAIARGLVCNAIGALNSLNESGRVIHLLTEYNTLTGLELTAATVYQPENFAPFMKWVYARIASISDLMTENSTMYQTTVQVQGTDKPIYRHTPVEKQHLYIYAPARHQIDARVLADTYHDSYLTKADVESVNFWQNIKSPDSIDANVAWTAANGGVGGSSGNVKVNNIFGLMFDDDFMGYALLDQRVVTTPVNASGLYRNMWLHCKQRVYMDNTEKAVLLLLD